jgi:hypothetical protein
MKKLLVMMLCGAMAFTSVPMYSHAATATLDAADPVIIKAEDPSSSKIEPTTSGLEDAILAVKAKITIPEAYSEFNYYFYDANTYSDAYWTLNWSNPTTNAYIQVNCDEDNHITYFYSYDYNKATTGVAKYLKSELQATADEFIAKIAPETTNQLRFVKATYEGVYSGNYVYQYERRNNGVSMPDNSVSVAVNSITGEVTYASVNWLYDTSVPSSKVKITKEQATALIKENMKMKLVYRSDYYGIYDIKGTRSSKAFLVYEPTISYISIDAKTGEVYLTRSEWVDTANSGKGNEESAASDAATGSTTKTLTDEEIAKIEELKNLISKDKAIDIITGNSSLYLEDTLKSYSASLTKTEDTNGKTSYIWNVSLSDPREIDYSKDKDTYRAYAYASVDASTGNILSFYSSMKGYYDESTQTYKTVKVKYNKEESRAILEKFLKKQTGDRFNNSVLSSEEDGYVAYYKNDQPVYGGYNYQYNRVNEKIEYPYNYISGSFDGVTGKIYSFGTCWDDSVVFESPKGAMTADQAMDYYLGNAGYGLKYEINVINKYDSSYEKLDSYYDYNDAYSVEYEVRLVYRPDVTPAYISPFTGKQLQYNGEVYTEKAPYTYSDVEKTDANRNILLLADMNIGFEGDKFLPDQLISVGEINTLLQDVGYGYGYDASEDDKADNLVTKEELAQLFINKLGLEKMSQLAGIYTTGYADAKDIKSDYLGAVALAKGFGIMTGDADNNFKAKSNVTRFAAVDYIMSLITAQQKGIY